MMMLSTTYVVFGSKKSRFIKDQNGSGILGSLANTLSKITLVGFILF